MEDTPPGLGGAPLGVMSFLMARRTAVNAP